MRNKILSAAFALAALGAVPAAAAPTPALLLAKPSAVAATAQYSDVRVWMDDDRDFFGLNDRMRVRVRADRDSYLAVFHIDTNGDLDVLYPRSSYDDGFVRGGRTLSLGSRSSDYLRARGGAGMGYVFAVALDEPLELWRLRDLYEPRYAGWSDTRGIYGDPFYAMDEIVRAIVPESALGYESVDHYTYHVGRRYTHPRYACYDGYGDWYSSRTAYYNSCERVRVLLINRPYYYDTRHWRGSRRGYYNDYYTTVRRAPRPLHGYKERTDTYAPPVRSSHQPRPRPSRPGASGSAQAPGRDTRPGTGRDDRPAVGRDERPATRGGEGSVSTRRPSPEPRVSAPGSTRRPSDVGAGSGPQQDQEPRQQGRPVAPERDRPTFQRRPPAEPRSNAPRREEQPRREQPRREEPRRESQPRREPPARQAEPRREEPRRETPPAREESSSRSSGSSAPRVRSPGA